MRVDENELLNTLGNPPNMITEDFDNYDFADGVEPPIEHDAAGGDNINNNLQTQTPAKIPVIFPSNVAVSSGSAGSSGVGGGQRVSPPRKSRTPPPKPRTPRKSPSILSKTSLDDFSNDVLD